VLTQALQHLDPLFEKQQSFILALEREEAFNVTTMEEQRSSVAILFLRHCLWWSVPSLTMEEQRSNMVERSIVVEESS
jgi:hypothetical protein